MNPENKYRWNFVSGCSWSMIWYMQWQLIIIIIFYFRNAGMSLYRLKFIPVWNLLVLKQINIIYQMTMRVLILMKVLSHWPPLPLKLQNGHPLRMMKTTIWIIRSLHQVTIAENSSFSWNVWIRFSSFVPSVGENATIKKRCWDSVGCF